MLLGQGSMLGRIYASARHLPKLFASHNAYRLTYRSQQFSISTTMANSERFFADRAAPLCSMDIAKSFGQLRSVVLLCCKVPEASNSRIQLYREKVHSLLDPGIMGRGTNHSGPVDGASEG